MSRFSIEDLLSQRNKDLEDAHADLWQCWVEISEAMRDIADRATDDTDRSDFLKGMTDLAYARKRLLWVKDYASRILKEVVPK
jgi:hypothetical protein|tara:strand:+ start:3101 stop:3349 length:249 start_codon:yes stop_codon:yes gene_type:complete